MYLSLKDITPVSLTALDSVMSTIRLFSVVYFYDIMSGGQDFVAIRT